MGSGSASSVASAQRMLVIALAGGLLFRLWLSAVFPFTGDEAYFWIWGVKPDLGYYDHPPMVGWILALTHRLSSEAWVQRLPATLLPTVLALMLWTSLRRFDQHKAALAASAFALVPIEFWNAFITTDMPLVLFSVAAALCFWRALLASDAASAADATDVTDVTDATVATGAGAWRWFAASGVLLGLALLSKYFAALLSFAFVVATLATPRRSRNWLGLWLCALCALPFFAFNLWWNQDHCWSNLMFNLYNRHDSAGASWKTPLLFLVSALYVLSPPALWQMLRSPAWRARWHSDVSLRFFTLAWGVPFTLFAALSSVKMIGLHWLLSFVPLFFCAAFFVLDAPQLRRSVRWLGVLTALHVLAAGAAAMLPLQSWQGLRQYDGIVFHFRIQPLLQQLTPWQDDYVLMADGYSPAVTTSFYAGRYVPVFGEASSHARHDDLVTDFRAYDGRNIMILRKNPPKAEDYAQYFREFTWQALQQDGATFWIVLGRGFRYSVYRDQVLSKVRDRYYRIPGYLPRGECVFCDRYFGANSCPVR